MMGRPQTAATIPPTARNGPKGKYSPKCRRPETSRTAANWPLTFRVLSQVDTVVAGCIITGGLFFLVAWVSHAALGRTGLGGGDIKLAGLIGAALGASGGLVAAFVGIMLGGVVAAILLVSGRRHFGEYLPFGPFLAVGGIVAAVWGRPIMEWYLG